MVLCCQKASKEHYYLSVLCVHVWSQAARLNRGFPASQQISYMTWVVEGVINKDQPWQNWKPK